MERLNRQGYGSSFNELYYNEDTILKKAKNEYGLQKIEFEKAFFAFVSSSKISFPIPEKIQVVEDGYSMRYYKGCKPLFLVLKESPEYLSQYLYNVCSQLDILHNSNKVILSKETVKRDLQFEMIEKIQTRYKEVESIVKSYSFVKTVNGIELESYENLFSFFEESIHLFLETKNEFTYCPIHGDCQFNNILLSSNREDLIFIDPRGYFGKSELYGLEEYDTAKLYFALTGYDIFDNMTVTQLEIDGSNLTLPEIAFDLSVLYSNSFTAILTASIWLGNPHSFKDQPLKAVYSYFYGLYLATLVYKHVKSLTK